ncbi:MAG TPA: T9SS type A sorting domain-containing protein [Candidatus Kapabacteria bacterium]|nr:T9SS type A sorting domain-containing protein [Candidatus Kapabacteria bacterium]
MKLRISIALLIALCTLPAEAQWQKITPRESHPVPSDGSTVNFPTVSLPLGMTYHIHTDGRVNVSSGSDIADACYYVNILPFNPTITPVAMKVKYGAGLEDWVWSFLAPKNYQSSHIYDLTLASTSSPLSFRFFDRQDPPSTYYNDNSGSIAVEVAQETPEIVVKYDTIYFNNVLIGGSQTILDSVESYGLEAYRCDNVVMAGPSAAKFGAMSQNIVPFQVTTETTNWFQFSYTPSAPVTDTAYFHLYSSNVYAPQKDFVIVLIGNGTGARLSNAPDTLDFGTITVGATKQLPEKFYNSGNSVGTINAIAMLPTTEPFAAAPTAFVVNPHDSTSTLVTFAPNVLGNFFASFTCQISDGSTRTFYAKGIAGSAKPFISDTVLDFGRVVLGQSRTLSDTLFNIGNTNLNVTSTLNSNPAEYVIIGPQGPQVYSPGSGAIYGITFKPNHHIPLCANHDGSFTFYFDDGSSKVVVFKGCDHQPLTAHLVIDTNYSVNQGKIIDVYQSLQDVLDSTITPIRSLSERISFDATLFDLVSVSKGPLVGSAAWQLNATPGAGFVDISLSSTTAQFGPTGTLLVLQFQAHPADTPGQFTLLPQMNIDFSNPIEPFAVTSSGKIRVTDLCSPVNLSNTTPGATFIEQNLPNPVAAHSTIRYHIGQTENGAVGVRLRVFDAMGRLVRTLVDEQQQNGYYEVNISNSEFENGLYWYLFEAGGYSESRSMLVVK